MQNLTILRQLEPFVTSGPLPLAIPSADSTTVLVNPPNIGQSPQLLYLSTSSPGPPSVSAPNVVSIGTEPRNRTPHSSAMILPPPLLNTFVTSPQHGHMYPAIFSTMPITGTEVFTQKFSSLRTSLVEIACGVVTTTAPESFEGRACGLNSGVESLCSSSTMAMCSSDVPGGVSMRR